MADPTNPNGNNHDIVPATTEFREHELDVYTLAKAHFDAKEYARCAHDLTQLQNTYKAGVSDLTPPTLLPRSLFLKCYATFLDSERQTLEQSEPYLSMFLLFSCSTMACFIK